jgi:aryl-alcohol dehydrogenase-like predicted oxidoreductase
VSAIGLGANHFGLEAPQERVNSIIDAALDAGINHIDTSDRYTLGRSEETLGCALKGRWGRVVLATKFSAVAGEGPNDRGASRYHLMHAVEASLRRLQSDHIDLYYVHWWDEQTPVEETLRALDDLIRAGKVRYIGVCNCAAWQAARANVLGEWRGWTPFAVVQHHYNMLHRDPERELLPYCRAHGVGFVPYFPLAGGFLTGKYRKGEPAPVGSRGSAGHRYEDHIRSYMTDANWLRVEKLSAWAEERGHTSVELAQAWLLAQPAVCSVISGATGPEQVRSNAKAAEWTLTPEDVTHADAILSGESQEPA